jgi:putative hydrolase of the HAD superfamily
LLSKAGYSIPEVFYRELKMEMWKNWKEQFIRSGDEFDIKVFLRHLLCNLGVRPKDVVKFVPSITNIIYKYDLESLVLRPTAKDTLEKLQQMSYLLGIISNTSFSYDHIFEILDRCGIVDYFSVVLVSSREKICKPNPRIFQKALQLLEISANNAVFVGNDPQVDIEGAKRVGMKTILVVHMEAKPNKLCNSDTRIAENVGDILKYIEK